MFGLTDQNLELIRNTLQGFPEVKEALIFGSRAMGNHKKGSDVDIALCGSEITSEKLLEVRVTLEERLPLPYHFDIVHYKKDLDADLKTHIDQHGIRFYPAQDRSAL